MVRSGPRQLGLMAGWDTAGRPIRATIIALGLLAGVAFGLQVIVLASASRWGWAANPAWVVAGLAACTGMVVGGSRLGGYPVARESWILWGLGAGCWTVGVAVAASLPAGQEGARAAFWFLALPLFYIFTCLRRVPRITLFVLFMLDAVPVVLLLLALTLPAQHPGYGLVFAGLFTGLYLLMAASSIQILGIHENVRQSPRTYLFTLAFCVLGFASLFGAPQGARPGNVLALWSGAAWTLGLLMLTVAAMIRMLQPSQFVTLLPAERQTGPHAVPPTVAVFGLITLVVVGPHQSLMLRGFLLTAAVILLIRICLVYQQAVRLITEVVNSRERLRKLAEVTSLLKSLVLDELLESFCRSAQEVLGARFAVFGIAGDDCVFSRLVAPDPDPLAGPDGDRPGLNMLPPEMLLRPASPVRLTEPTRDPQAAGFPPGYCPAEGFLGVPVAVGGTGYGMLYLAGKRGGFSEEDESLAELLAISGGYAIVNAALYAESKSQQQLLATQNDSLRELDKMKDEFIALVSHELRTPLTSIIGYVELLRDDASEARDPAYQRFAEIIDRNAQRLLRLVKDLLFLSHLQTGKMEMDMRDADLGDIVIRAVEDAQSRAQDRHIDLSVSVTPARPLRCDPGRIAQVVDNLITNALKFTPAGGRVAVSSAPQRDGILIEVADTGVGISPADQARIFDSFFRSASATKRGIPGTGLGLTITKAIADAHNARITIDSGEGTGTTFGIWIPSQPTHNLPDPDRAANPKAASRS
jgi:signal transduction histidine kinase